MVHYFLTLLIVGSIKEMNKVDPCEASKTGILFINQFIADSIYSKATKAIESTAAVDIAEHCIAFGVNGAGYTSSVISNGGSSSAAVPAISNAFADLHNHLNNLPPDAGDIYGLIAKCSNQPLYKVRFVLTISGNEYALLITNREDAIMFANNYPKQNSTAPGLQPTFPEKIIELFRKIKYEHSTDDETAISYILEKYNTGIYLFKKEKNSDFRLLKVEYRVVYGRQSFQKSYCK